MRMRSGYVLAVVLFVLMVGCVDSPERRTRDAGTDVVDAERPDGSVDVERDGGDARADADSDADGQKPRLVEVRPDEGLAEGGEEVSLYGKNFDDVTGVEFNGEPAEQVEVVDSNSIDLVTPPAEDDDDRIELLEGDASTEFTRKFNYIRPTSVRGEPLDDELKVEVISAGGFAIEHAYVKIVGTDIDGFTDTDGKVVLADADMPEEPTVVTATRGYPSGLIQGVESDQVTIALFSETYGAAPAAPPPARVEGDLEGLDEISTEGPDEEVVVRICTTGDGADDGGCQRVPSELVIEDNYRESVHSRRLAVIGVAGVWHRVEERFEPKRLGIARELIVEEDETVRADLNFDIELADRTDIRWSDAPFEEQDDVEAETSAYLDLGRDGVGWIGNVAGEGAEVDMDQLPALDGPLASAKFRFVGSFVLSDYSQAARGKIRGVEEVAQPVESQTMVPPVSVVEPEDEEVVEPGDTIDFDNEAVDTTDFVDVRVTGAFGTLIWHMVLPPDTDSVRLPDFSGMGEPSDDAEYWIEPEPYPEGTYPMYVRAYDFGGLDYGDFWTHVPWRTDWTSISRTQTVIGFD